MISYCRLPYCSHQSIPRRFLKALFRGDGIFLLGDRYCWYYIRHRISRMICWYGLNFVFAIVSWGLNKTSVSNCIFIIVTYQTMSYWAIIYKTTMWNLHHHCWKDLFYRNPITNIRVKCCEKRFWVQSLLGKNQACSKTLRDPPHGFIWRKIENRFP